MQTLLVNFTALLITIYFITVERRKQAKLNIYGLSFEVSLFTGGFFAWINFTAFSNNRPDKHKEWIFREKNKHACYRFMSCCAYLFISL